MLQLCPVFFCYHYVPSFYVTIMSRLFYVAIMSRFCVLQLRPVFFMIQVCPVFFMLQLCPVFGNISHKWDKSILCRVLSRKWDKTVLIASGRPAAICAADRIAAVYARVRARVRARAHGLPTYHTKKGGGLYVLYHDVLQRWLLQSVRMTTKRWWTRR